MAGLSPLARGTPVFAGDDLWQARFIPARAGNTSDLYSLPLALPVYPRSRGEHQRPLFPPAGAPGLSPLARGTRQALRLALPALRFIPARAGNTPQTCTSQRRPTVYPRSRGEHQAGFDEREIEAGLSPLARGTRHRQLCCCSSSRFIPARAGNTEARRKFRIGEPVYPRSRGEHTGTSPASAFAHGLSPLARGTLPTASVRTLKKRFIPARAGNTPAPPLSVLLRSVYPRSRGEHRVSYASPVAVLGLSPLARGTRYLLGSEPNFWRFIPARAGNTLKLCNCSIRKFFTPNNLPTFLLHLHILKEQLTY